MRDQNHATGKAMNDSLTKDEYEALAQIRKARKGERPSACVARNAKALIGLKYVTRGKDGAFMLTDKGQQTLLVKRCIDGLRLVATAAVAATAPAKLDADVVAFLSRKGLIAPHAAGEGFELTVRGRESLADIESREGKSA
jgi:predicted transcriptional regulator